MSLDLDWLLLLGSTLGNMGGETPLNIELVALGTVYLGLVLPPVI